MITPEVRAKLDAAREHRCFINGMRRLAWNEARARAAQFRVSVLDVLHGEAIALNDAITAAKLRFREPNYNAEMKLPEGRTCGHCWHVLHCLALGYTSSSENTRCDFYPNRFSETHIGVARTREDLANAGWRQAALRALQERSAVL